MGSLFLFSPIASDGYRRAKGTLRFDMIDRYLLARARALFVARSDERLNDSRPGTLASLKIASLLGRREVKRNAACQDQRNVTRMLLVLILSHPDPLPLIGLRRHRLRSRPRRRRAAPPEAGCALCRR